MFVKKSADGNRAAVIQVRITPYNISGSGINSRVRVEAALHIADPNPDPDYSCDGCTFLDGRDGEMYEWPGLGQLEQAITDLIEAKQNEMLEYIQRKEE